MYRAAGRLLNCYMVGVGDGDARGHGEVRASRGGGGGSGAAARAKSELRRVVHVLEALRVNDEFAATALARLLPGVPNHITAHTALRRHDFRLEDMLLRHL